MSLRSLRNHGKSNIVFPTRKKMLLIRIKNQIAFLENLFEYEEENFELPLSIVRKIEEFETAKDLQTLEEVNDELSYLFFKEKLKIFDPLPSYEVNAQDNNLNTIF